MAYLTATATMDRALEPGRLRAVQTGVLWATLATLALVPAIIVLFFASNWLSLRVFAIPDAYVSLTPAAWTAYTVCLGGLLLCCAALQVMAPRAGLVIAVLAALFVSTLFMLTDPFRLAVVAAGALALMFGSIIGARRLSGGGTATVIVLSAVLSLVSGAVLLTNLVVRELARGEIFTLTTDYVRERSPDGGWLLVAEQYDEGALGGSVSVSIQRDVLGVLRIQRNIYDGDWGEPRVRWLDSRTVQVGKNRVDIYKGRSVSGYD
jgi:hypothetical protein